MRFDWGRRRNRPFPHEGREKRGEVWIEEEEWGGGGGGRRKGEGEEGGNGEERRKKSYGSRNTWMAPFP